MVRFDALGRRLAKTASGLVTTFVHFGNRTTLAPDGITTRAVSSYNQQVGFTGRYLDKETGLWYFRARYYSGSLGRFIGRDPWKQNRSVAQSGDGYSDGMNFYVAYFIPGQTDPAGEKTYSPELIQGGLTQGGPHENGFFPTSFYAYGSAYSTWNSFRLSAFTNAFTYRILWTQRGSAKAEWNVKIKCDSEGKIMYDTSGTTQHKDSIASVLLIKSVLVEGEKLTITAGSSHARGATDFPKVEVVKVPISWPDAGESIDFDLGIHIWKCVCLDDKK